MEDYPPFLLSIAVHILLRNAAQALCIPSEVEQFETQDFKLGVLNSLGCVKGQTQINSKVTISPTRLLAMVLLSELRTGERSGKPDLYHTQTFHPGGKTRASKALSISLCCQ
jgi:hypothetical protein